ncbi:MAG: J domain-containing protein [Clostridia bacterium]|nr:J domain-containing protein [Clostridia bacterium]
MLGLKATADADEVRTAYRALVKKCHPDRFLDADEQHAAREKLIALNLAYEEALKLAVPRKTTTYTHALPKNDACQLARKMLHQQNPASALRQLMRSESRDADWYFLQGQILMELRQYESAHQSFREAVKRSPDNIEYRRGALDAAVAMKKANTLGGKLRAMFEKKQ